MATYENQELSPREYVLLENERDENRLIREHAVRLKELELALEKEKASAEVELKRLEAKWSSWLAIPKTIIKLPVYTLLAIGYIMAVITKQKPPQQFWDFINK